MYAKRNLVFREGHKGAASRGVVDLVVARPRLFPHVQHKPGHLPVSSEVCCVPRNPTAWYVRVGRSAIPDAFQAHLAVGQGALSDLRYCQADSVLCGEGDTYDDFAGRCH